MGMGLVISSIFVLVGGLAGWLAGHVMRRGGFGLQWDLTLGLAGSALSSWVFWALGVSPDVALPLLPIVAFTGAAIPIVAQRKLWPTI
jgi:uncharacterized membrane protein YeaQ/YmgE (transglycosylase-associated protein family)